ncbi:hypothetical protein BBP40_011239 [Aspergillus hancockii]|nr:hypothetical protein BBP40_011239 [Aspergillus hancockii]
MSTIHAQTQILGFGCEIKPNSRDREEAEAHLGVWMTGYLSWAFEHRTGPELPPPVVVCISVGDYRDFYIIYGVQEETGDVKEVYVWDPLPELGGRTSNEKTGPTNQNTPPGYGIHTWSIYRPIAKIGDRLTPQTYLMISILALYFSGFCVSKS